MIDKLCWVGFRLCLLWFGYVAITTPGWGVKINAIVVYVLFAVSEWQDWRKDARRKCQAGTEVRNSSH